MSEYKGTKYPKECYSAVRTQTFSVTTQFCLATAAEGYSPTKIYSPFSRFVIAVINEKKKVASANVPLSEFADISENARNAQMMEMYAKVFSLTPTAQTAAGSEADNIAYSVRIGSGKLKGKSPAEVLLGDPNGGKTALENQKNWLSQNLTQYPKNQQQIDAIDAALRLLTSGALENGDANVVAASGKRIEIYEAKYRALIRKGREDGRCPVYDIGIYWTLGKQYPVEVQVINYWAPVTKNPNGTLNVQASQAVDKIDNVFRMTKSEWNDCVRSMQAAMHQFEVIHARMCIADAEDADRRNREQKN